MLEAAFPGASSVPLVLCDAGGRRPLQEASSASGVGRRTTRSEPCVGNAEDIAEEEWALKLGIFPVCGGLPDSFGFFQPSVAQASSEGWFGRLLNRQTTGVLFFSEPARLGVTSSPSLASNTISTRPAIRRRARSRRSRTHTSAASERSGRGSAPTDARRRRTAAGSEGARRASLRLEATRRRTRTRARPRITAPAFRRSAQLRGPAHHHG